MSFYQRGLNQDQMRRSVGDAAEPERKSVRELFINPFTVITFILGIFTGRLFR